MLKQKAVAASQNGFQHLIARLQVGCTDINQLLTCACVPAAHKGLGLPTEEASDIRKGTSLSLSQGQTDMRQGL